VYLVLTCRRSRHRRAEFAAAARRQRCAGARYAWTALPLRRSRLRYRPVGCARHGRPIKRKMDGWLMRSYG